MKDMIDIYKNIIEQHIADYYNKDDENDFVWDEFTHPILNYSEYKFRSVLKDYLAVTAWIDNTDFNKTITYYIHPKIRGRTALKNKLNLLGFNQFQDYIPF